MERDEIYDLERGKGGLKYFHYWTAGIRLRTKEDIFKALELKFDVLREDKITKKIQRFDYKTKCFKEVKKWT